MPPAWSERPEAISKSPTHARHPRQSTSPCGPISQTVSRAHWMRSFHIISVYLWRRPGSGKTVIACGVIAHRRLPTLIVVDRQPLVEQWRERLGEHLGMATKEIGQLGGGRNKAKGAIDIAMAQSLARREDLGEIAKAYGLVIVDECHHVPAVTFERVVREMPVRHWLGLTATPYRRDHLEKLITMYCGAERHRMTPDHDENLRVERVLVTHTTGHEQSGDEELSIQAVFRSLVEDEERSRQICGDVAAAIEVRAKLPCAHAVDGAPRITLRRTPTARDRSDRDARRDGQEGPGERLGRDAGAGLCWWTRSTGDGKLPRGGIRPSAARHAVPRVSLGIQGPHRSVRGSSTSAYVGKIASRGARLRRHQCARLGPDAGEASPGLRLTGFSARQDGAKPEQGGDGGFARAPSVGRCGFREPIAHPFAHPFSPIGWTRALTLDACRAMTRHDGTGAHLLDVPARSLKVATRVRIPLGLQKKNDWPEPRLGTAFDRGRVVEGAVAPDAADQRW